VSLSTRDQFDNLASSSSLTCDVTLTEDDSATHTETASIVAGVAQVSFQLQRVQTFVVSLTSCSVAGLDISDTSSKAISAGMYIASIFFLSLPAVSRPPELICMSWNGLLAHAIPLVHYPKQ
jgi:hypothetical protein